MRNHLTYWIDQLQADNEFSRLRFKRLVRSPVRDETDDLLDIVGMEEFMQVEPDRIPLFVGTQFGLSPRMESIEGFRDTDKYFAVLGKSVLSGAIGNLEIFSLVNGQPKQIKVFPNRTTKSREEIERENVARPELFYVTETAKAYNKLDFSFIWSVASEDLVYESQDVFSALEGRTNVFNYFFPKFSTIRKSGQRVFAEIGFLPGEPSAGMHETSEANRPCIILAQGTKENKIALVQVKVSSGRIIRIDVCTVFPHWSEAVPTGCWPS